MSRSEYFKYRIKMKKVFAILLEIAFLIIIFAFFPDKADKVTRNVVLVLYCLVIVASIIVTINYVSKSNKYSEKELEKICNELDGKIEKVFPKLGLYFTKNYVVCMGNINPFRVFAVETKKIEMINFSFFMRHDFYKSEKKREAKRKGKEEKLLKEFVRYSIKDSIYHPGSSENRFRVFDLMCDDGLYRITIYNIWNKRKQKYINEAIDYFSEILPNVHYR